jgi:hypothetical protein
MNHNFVLRLSLTKQMENITFLKLKKSLNKTLVRLCVS